MEQKRKNKNTIRRTKLFIFYSNKIEKSVIFLDFLHNYWCRFFILTYFIYHFVRSSVQHQVYANFFNLHQINFIYGRIEFSSKQKRTYFEIDRLICESFDILFIIDEYFLNIDCYLNKFFLIDSDIFRLVLIWSYHS